MVVRNIHEAKTHLSALLEESQRGEDVVIANHGRPIVRLVPVVTPPRQPGDFRGQIQGDICGGLGDDDSAWG